MVREGDCHLPALFSPTFPTVDGVSKLSFQCGSRGYSKIERRAATQPLFSIFHNFDTPSTTGLVNCLTLNVLYTINAAETQHATSLRLGKIAF